MSRLGSLSVAIAFVVLIAGLTAAAAGTAVVDVTLVSVGDGVEANADSYSPMVSADGGTIVYWSAASNLVADDANEFADVFAFDVATGATTRVSVGDGGAEANSDSYSPMVSANGGTIVYSSDASNLVANDTNEKRDVFAFDVATGATTRISVGDGVEANDHSRNPATSGDGGTIVYSSDASNLVADDTNESRDVFAFDVATAITTRVSVDSAGLEANRGNYAPVVSADGGTIVYESDASNLVADDGNGAFDVFAYEVATGTTTRISVGAGGTEGNNNSSNPAISADGGTIVYESWATNLVANDTNGSVDMFANEVATGATTRISVGAGVEANDDSRNPAISADGGTIAYSSVASNLVADDDNGAFDVFAYDIASGITTRVSVNSDGAEANWHSSRPEVSADGSTIVYRSAASNLVVDDTSHNWDVFAARLNRSPRAEGFTTAVAADVAIGTAVGTVTASDPDNDPLTFTISAGDTGGLFSIGPTSGIVFTAKKLDYQTVASYTLTVTVSDGSLTGTATVMVIDPEYDPFDDDGSIFEDDIEWLALSGITTGCETRLFCPNSPVTRGQMAAFLHRALDGIVEPTGTAIDFDDDDDSVFVADIAWLSATGITKGCTASEYCPDKPVTRGQMAAFLVRALSYTDDGRGNLFVDDDDSIFETDIDKLATAGVTLGCNPPVNDQFCPDKVVTRGQMAAFLRRAFG